MKIAVMGGTFNPIHSGHLIVAEQVRESFNFDRIFFIPSKYPPHKDQTNIIEAHHRYEMTKIATSDNPNFKVSSIEIDRTGISYTIDTVEQLQENYGKNSEISCIIGADSLIEFKTWKNYNQLLEICRFIATTRPNYPLSEAHQELVDRVEIFPVPEIGISGTEIRKRVKIGQSIRYLVPRKVEKYIYDNFLYKEIKK